MMYRVPNAMHEEMLNWARWANQGAWPHPLPRTQCGSAEGDYRAPPEWDLDLDELNRTSKIRPNERNARKVQAAWESLSEGSIPRLALQAEYPGNDHQGFRSDRAKALNITVSQYEDGLRDAVNRVEQAFEVRK
ncbi:hypothetical protein [Variovorax sp. GT1P44]|uniref:hypothetical protein n=1 Tax=Variovorax sp. GT1P44 TaxID=3443742 RepID=UPI003F459191